MFKILSLDGGGSWSILQLYTLKEIFGNKSGHEILRHFDLVIANSGGSIVLAALAENWTIDEALKLFEDSKVREKIFNKNTFKYRYFPIDYIRLFTSFGPKYSTKKKGEAFKELFKNIDKLQMEDLPKFIGKETLKLVICTYDALNNKAKFFKSFTFSNEVFDSVRLTQAIHGSSNAPVQYFDFPARFKASNSNIYYELWDGALGGFNNPVVAGLIEAIKSGIELQKIKIVSIGTGNKIMSILDKERYYQVKQITTKERFNKLNIFRLKYQIEFFKHTVLNQAKTILYEPPDWANYVASVFLSLSNSNEKNTNFVRLSPLIHIDNNTESTVIELIHKLYNLDMDLTDYEDILLIRTLFENWKIGKIKNHPIDFRINRDNSIEYLQGAKTFKDAMDLINSWQNGTISF